MLGVNSGASAPSTGKGARGSGYVGSSMLARTVMIFGVLSVATQVAYSMCQDEISVSVLIFVPPQAKIGRDINV